MSSTMRGMPAHGTGGTVTAILPLPSSKRKKKGKGRKPATLTQVRALIAAAKPHLKYTDAFAGVNLDSAGNVWDLSIIPQGSSGSPTTRLGTSVRLQKLEVRGMVGTPTSGDPYNAVRVLIVRWYKDVAAQGGVVVGTFLESTFLSVPGAPFAPITYNQGLQMIRTFKVLYDVTLNVAPGMGSAVFSVEIPLDVRADFNGSLGTESESLSNTIFLVAVSDSAVIPYPSITYVSRLWWTDEV